jgi:hypothetical protein
MTSHLGVFVTKQYRLEAKHLEELVSKNDINKQLCVKIGREVGEVEKAEKLSCKFIDLWTLFNIGGDEIVDRNRHANDEKDHIEGDRHGGEFSVSRVYSSSCRHLSQRVASVIFSLNNSATRLTNASNDQHAQC